MSATRVGSFLMRLARLEDMAALRPIVTQAFKDEPTVAYTNTTLQAFEKLADLTLEHALPEGHSWVAEDAGGGLASFILYGDFGRVIPAEHPLTHFVLNHEHLGVFEAIEARLEAEFAALLGHTIDAFPRGLAMQLRMGGTVPEMRNRGINSRLQDLSMSHIRGLGFRYVMSISTNRFTRRMSDHNLMRPVRDLMLAELFPGPSPYTRCVADGHNAIRLVVRDFDKDDIDRAASDRPSP